MAGRHKRKNIRARKIRFRPECYIHRINRSSQSGIDMIVAYIALDQNIGNGSRASAKEIERAGRNIIALGAKLNGPAFDCNTAGYTGIVNSACNGERRSGNGVDLLISDKER